MKKCQSDLIKLTSSFVFSVVASFEIRKKDKNRKQTLLKNNKKPFMGEKSFSNKEFHRNYNFTFFKKKLVVNVSDKIEFCV